MVKLVYCITKKADLSVEEFQRYWREVHGPIAAAIPGVRRYVQSHGVSSPLGDTSRPTFDGVAELWWDDVDAMRAAMGSPEVQAAIEDERKFIDHTRVAMLVTEERVVVG